MLHHALFLPGSVTFSDSKSSNTVMTTNVLEGVDHSLINPMSHVADVANVGVEGILGGLDQGDKILLGKFYSISLATAP